MVKATSFLDTHVHKHKRTILELAILLTSEKKFEEFTQALMVFLTNAQMVDPKFVINPLRSFYCSCHSRMAAYLRQNL